MRGRFLFITILLLLGCDKRVIRLDVAGEDTGMRCLGEINDAGECIVRGRRMDSQDSDEDNREEMGECERIQQVLAACIENLGADDPQCISLQERLDAC